MERQYFGTDGIRGQVGEAPITPDFMLKLGWAVGRVFSESGQGKARFLIGKDTRLSGYMFESALEAGLSAAGADVWLLGPMPTPAIAYLTRTFRAQAGFVISASHNPHHDNGIKFFSAEGVKLDDAVEQKIEAYLDQPLMVVPSDQLGKARRVEDAEGRYIEFCKSSFERSLSLKGLKIVVDCAQGATYRVGPAVFEELGAEVVRLHADPDGLNINLKCGSTEPQALQEKVVVESADIGIAFDGDGDRVVMVDHLGHLIDGDELLYVIARHKADSTGGVVGTQMTNLGLENAIRDLGLGFERSKVGDRYVFETLQQKNWILGGESSGHIISLDKTSTGDAIIAALQVLEALLMSEQTLHEACAGVQKYPQLMVNVKVRDKQQVLSDASVSAAVAAAEERMGKAGRVLLRPSGTEPLIRVMVEGEDQELVKTLVDGIADEVRKASA